jgi:hypothetical protein
MFRNSVLFGFVVGLFFFVAFYFGLYHLNEALTGSVVLGHPFNGVRPQFVGILAVVSLILPFWVFNKRRLDYSMRGVGIATILLATGVIIYFNILGN